MEKQFFLIGGFIFLFGFSFFAVALGLGLRRFFKMKKSIKTLGVVVHLETMQGMRNEHGGRSTLFKPTVRFQTADGRLIDYTPTLANNTSNYNVGENVEIYYDPQQPQNAIIGTTTWGWVRFAIFAVCGGFLALFGAGFMLISGFLF